MQSFGRVKRVRGRSASATSTIESLEWRVLLAGTTSTISGKVFLDDDADGVQDVSEGRGIAARTIYVDLNHNGAFDSGETSTQTDNLGNYTLNPPNPGVPTQYMIREIASANWVQTLPANNQPILVTVAPDTAVSGQNFGTSLPTNLISGKIYHDQNLDQVDNANEPQLAGWRVFIDNNANHQFDAGEPTALSDSTGYYELAYPTTSKSVVMELVAQAGWQGVQGGWGFGTPPGSGSWYFSDKDLGATKGSIFRGLAYIDSDNSGAINPSDGRIAGMTVYIDLNKNGVLDAGEPSDITEADGFYLVGNIPGGTYTVREILSSPYTAATPGGDSYTATVPDLWQLSSMDFRNVVSTAAITGTVFKDLDDNGVLGATDTRIAGHTIYLDTNNNRVLDSGEQTAISNANGVYAFNAMPAGSYILRDATGESGMETSSPASSTNAWAAAVSNGQTVVRDFGFAPPSASITGIIYQDKNANGGREIGEPAIANVIIFLDANNDGIYQQGEKYSITDANGAYSFTHLPKGANNVRAALPYGWTVRHPINVDYYPWELSHGSQVSGDFGVVAPTTGGQIRGTVFNDQDGDGVKDAGEPGLILTTVYNDANNNSKLDAGEPRTMTDGLGAYQFSGLPAGSYKIRQVLVSGWKQTTPANNYGWTLTLATNGSLAGKDFGASFVNTPPPPPPPPTGGSIAGTVWNDLDGDGVKDSNEVGVAGITVYNDANNNSKLDSGEKTTVTDANGLYTLAGLSSGSYKIRQILQSGWVQTTPANNYGWTLSLASNQQLTGKNFGTKQTGVTPPPPTKGSLAGFTFDDTNKNGAFDAGEKKTSGKTVFLDTNNNGKLDSGEKSIATDSGGNWSFSGLAAGLYHVRRVFPAGYGYSTTLIDINLADGQAVSGLLIGSKSV
jgi:hypothetical protein